MCGKRGCRKGASLQVDFGRDAQARIMRSMRAVSVSTDPRIILHPDFVGSPSPRKSVHVSVASSTSSYVHSQVSDDECAHLRSLSLARGYVGSIRRICYVWTILRVRG